MTLFKNIFLSGRNKTNSAFALFASVLILAALAVIFFCTTGVAGTSYYAWRKETSNTVVLQVFTFNPPPDSESESAPEHALEKLSNLPFVKKVTLLSKEQILDLSSDWFTNTGIIESLNLPGIFTIELSSYSDSALLKETALELSQDFVISDHTAIVDNAASIFNRLFIASAVVSVLMILLIFFVVSSMCRFIVFTEKESIKMLSNLGARDRQIATLLQRKVTLIAAAGAFLGYLLAVLVLSLLFFRLSGLFVFAPLSKVLFILLIGLIIPIVTILLAAFTSYRYSLDSKTTPY
ncbi:MAG: hypothetical protein FWF23_02875 [Alphaproteobacteria bacterium]|nr:hypothetical protein [Alphaproteobacteria bacterium]MCL2504948.1 hypothetical protein [Alphaproteobacteria bacterium]